MKANINAMVWVGVILVAAACGGCTPRTVQRCEPDSGSTALANLGPKVGQPVLPSYAQASPAPKYTNIVGEKLPVAGMSKASFGDPKSGSSYASNFDQPAARFDLKNAPLVQSKFPLPAHPSKSAALGEPGQRIKLSAPAFSAGPMLPDLPDEPEAAELAGSSAKITFLQLPSPKPSVLTEGSIPLPPELPKIDKVQQPTPPAPVPSVAKPIPILLSTVKQTPPAPLTAKASTASPARPESKPAAPPAVPQSISAETPPAPPFTEPPVPHVAPARPQLPDQPPLPPEPVPAPPPIAKPIYIEALLPPAPVSTDAEPQVVSQGPPAPKPGKVGNLPPTPPTAPVPPAPVAPPAPFPPPIEPGKVVMPNKIAPVAPAPVQFQQQTEEPPPLLLAKPLPVNGLQPVSKGTPGKPAGDLASLHQLAAESYATIDSYIVRFRRREQVGGKDQPEELMLFKYRKQPSSVYFKWLAGGAKGREVVYVKGKYGNKLHTLVAAGDIPLIPAGKKISLGIDSALVRAKSRHSISDAGIGNAIEQFGTLVDNMKNKDYRFGSLKYLGLVNRPEYEMQVEAVLQVIPPKAESELPKGGKRFWYFDTKLRFPVLMITFDDKNHEVEYYCYDRWLFPGRLSDDEFNPHVLWKEE